MQLLRNLCVQRIAWNPSRRNLSESEQVWHGEIFRGFENGIAISHIQVEILERAAVEQAENWKTETASGRSCGCFGRFANFKLEPVTEIKGCSRLQMRESLSPGPAVGR